MSLRERCSLRFSLQEECPWWVGGLISLVLYAGLRWAPFLASFREECERFDLCCMAAPQAAPLALLLLVGLAVESLMRLLRPAWGTPTSAAIKAERQLLTASDMASLVTAFYQRQGYVVKASYDYGLIGGVDVELRRDGQRTLVQCKPWRGKLVDVSVLRELYAVMQSGQVVAGVVLTTSAFTPDARVFAQGKPLTLIDGALLNDMVKSVDNGAEVAATVVAVPAAPPACPLCDGRMVQRQVKHGPTLGQWFWGCLSFPSCPGTVPSEKPTTTVSLVKKE